MPDPLASPSAYQAFIYSLPERYEAIERSALVYVASGSLFGRVEGRVFFEGAIVLCVQEFLNFEWSSSPAAKCFRVWGLSLGKRPVHDPYHDIPSAS